ncbi:hypothetical protein ABT160_10345, partial [Streptomyces sp. NPDC001941]
MTTDRRGVRGPGPALAAIVVAGLLAGAPGAAALEASGTTARAGAPGAVPEAAGKAVKYYVVTKLPNGEPEFLFAIAEKVLGDGNRFNEIFTLNKGRPQPDGGVMRTATNIAPGWILVLPADAKGPGVQQGVLPTTTPPRTAGSAPPDAAADPAPAPAQSPPQPR